MPRSKEDFKIINDQRKQSIMDAGLRLFSIHGYDAISVDDITKECKCSHGLFYHYFNSKLDLFESLIEYIISKWGNKLNALDFDQKPTYAIKDITSFFLESLNDDEDAYILYMFLTFHLQKKLPDLKRKKDEKRTPIKRLLDLIKKGQDEKEFELGEPSEYLRTYFSCLQGLTYNRIHLGSKKFKPVSTNVICNLFIRKEKE